MDLWLDDEAETASDPMDTVESVIGSDERFQCERAEDGDLHFSFKTSWGESVGYFSYRHELPALLFTLGFEIQAPVSRRVETLKLAALINENLWLGHFDVWSDDGTIIFRHAMPMIGATKSRSAKCRRCCGSNGCSRRFSRRSSMASRRHVG
jgi:hypothetical protein